MPEVTKKNIHVPLPLELHEGLKEQAERLGAPATTLARSAIEEWVERKRREQLDQELRRYVVEMAGSDVDLDVDLEAAGVDSWLQSED